MEKRVGNAQAYAHSFEFAMRKVFNCNRGGACGMADADFIRRNPCAAVVGTCMYIYANADEEKREIINNFLSDVTYHFRYDFDTLLSFETEEKQINNVMVTLEYENGEKAIEEINKKFQDIVND